jgi:transposase
MPERLCFVGLDVHARRTAGAAVQLGSGEVFKAQIPGPPVEAIGWLQTLPGPIRAVYEAGPTGFGLAREARAMGIEMMVCAPGAIPRQPGDRVKTDTRDALKLARLLAAGQLRPVTVPEPELEALRDLVRCREDLRGDLMACRHRITKLLLRRGLIYPGPGAAWTRRHASWLTFAPAAAVGHASVSSSRALPPAPGAQRTRRRRHAWRRRDRPPRRACHPPRRRACRRPHADADAHR